MLKKIDIFWVPCFLLTMLFFVGNSAQVGASPILVNGKIQQIEEEPPNGQLGFAVFVTAGSDANGDGLEKTNRLWFAADPGSSTSRAIKISSTSSITQIVAFETISGARQVGGTLERAPEIVSPAANWISFNPAELELAPGETRELIVAYAVPIDAPNGFYESFLKLRASSKAKSTAQFSIPTAVSTLLEMSLSVGSAQELVPNFDIVDVEGFLADSGPSLRIYFDNRGAIPISLSGRVQLASIDFENVRSDSIPFLTKIILPQSSGFVDVPMSDPVEAGRWRIYVDAFQGSTKKSEVFERDLTFDGPPSGAQRNFGLNWQRIILGLVAVALIAGARKTMSSDSSALEVEIGEASATHQSEIKKEITIWQSKLNQKLQSAKKWADKARAEQGQSESTTDSTMSAESGDIETPRIEDIPVEPNLTSDNIMESNAEALRVLQKLYEDGILTEAEHARKRREILKRF
jgi:hypothetical protein